MKEKAMIDVHYDEERGEWRAKVAIEIVAFDKREEDVRIELNRTLDKIVREIKEENSKTYEEKSGFDVV